MIVVAELRGSFTVTDSADSIKSLWQSIFRRKGGVGAYTRLFDDLEPSQRDALLATVGLREAELPVIGSLRGPDTWLMLTTERLVWSIAGGRHELAAEAIRDIKADLRRPLESGNTKLEMRTLKVISRTGEEFTIELEPREPLMGTWSVLLNLTRRNRRASQRGRYETSLSGRVIRSRRRP